jgi:GNAT superfamily N-acetyltransferase
VPRVATRDDAELVTRLLVDAFGNDAMWGEWAFPDARGREANRTAVFRTLVDGALRYPTTWIMPGDTAVAVWIPPGGTALAPDQERRLQADLRGRVGADEAARILTSLDLFEEMEPIEPHYYLSLLGTDPACAGRGWGRQLLAHNLRAVDEAGAPAYLDCADHLVPFYERFGFRVVGSLLLPGGPRSNGMWRPRSR